MGCSSSKAAVSPATDAPTKPESPTSNKTTQSDSASGTDAMERAEHVGSTASAALATAEGILAAAPPGVADSLASGAASVAGAAAQYTAETPASRPSSAASAARLPNCSVRSPPAIPFVGAAAAVFSKALEQGQAYAQAQKAARTSGKSSKTAAPPSRSSQGKRLLLLSMPHSWDMRRERYATRSTCSPSRMQREAIKSACRGV